MNYKCKKNPVVKFYSKYSVLRTLINETQSQVVRILHIRDRQVKNLYQYLPVVERGNGVTDIQQNTGCKAGRTKMPGHFSKNDH